MVSHTAPTEVSVMSFGLSLWKMNSIVLVPACFFHHWDRQPSSLHIELVHIGSFLFTRSLYTTIVPVVLQCMWCVIGSTVVVYFLGSMR